MAARRRPRLVPVAAPTDPYVTPGVPTPRPPTFDFGAFRGLSETIRQSGEIQDRATEKRKKQAAEDYKRAGPKLKHLLDKTPGGMASPLAGVEHTLSFLFTDTKVTAENLQTLKDRGIDASNEYLILLLREQMGRRVVREGNYEGWMSDPKFMAQLAHKRATGDAKAEQFYGDHKKAWEEKHAMGVSQLMMPAYANEVAGIDYRLAQSYRSATRKALTAEEHRTLASESYKLGQSALREWRVSGTFLEMHEGLDQQAEWLKLANLMGDKSERTKALMNGIQVTVTTLARENEEAADAFLDANQERFGNAEMMGQFQTMRQALARQVRQLKDKSENLMPAASRALDSIVWRDLATGEMDITGYFNPDGGFGAAVKKVADEHPGVDPDDLYGKGSVLQQKAYTRQASIAAHGNPKTYGEVAKVMISDASDAVADLVLERAYSSGEITAPQYLDLERMRASHQSRGIGSIPVVTARKLGQESLMALVGDLANTPEALVAKAALLKIYSNAFKSNYKTPDEVHVAVAAAMKATQESVEYKAVQEYRSQLTASHWKDPKVITPILANLLAELETDKKVDLENAPDEQREMITRANREKRQALILKAESTITDLVKTKSFKAAEGEGDRQRMIRDAINSGWAKSVELAASQYIRASSKGKLVGQLTRMNKNAQRSLRTISSTFRRMSGGNLDRPDLWFFEQFSTYQVAGQSTRGYLESVAAGTEPDYRSLTHSEPYLQSVLLSALAFLEGNRAPEGTPRAKLHPQDGVLRDIGSETAARSILEGQIYLRGLTADNLKSGKFYGVPLKDLLGEGWRAELSLSQVALADDLDEIDSLDNSMVRTTIDGRTTVTGKLANIMHSLNYDPRDAEQVGKFLELQRELIRARTTGITLERFSPGVGLMRRLRMGIMSETTSERANTEWMQNLKTRLRSGDK